MGEPMPNGYQVTIAVSGAVTARAMDHVTGGLRDLAMLSLLT